MPIPDFQKIMLPLLELYKDGLPHRVQEFSQILEDHFGLTEEERNELLQSGTQKRFENRIGWARTHLKKAGLLLNSQSGVYQLTERGREILNSKPSKIDLHFLDQFEEHVEFRKRRNSPHNNSQTEIDTIEPSSQTPKEILE